MGERPTPHSSPFSFPLWTLRFEGSNGLSLGVMKHHLTVSGAARRAKKGEAQLARAVGAFRRALRSTTSEGSQREPAWHCGRTIHTVAGRPHRAGAKKAFQDQLIW